MLTIGDQLPAYSLKGVISHDLQNAFKSFSDQDNAGQWKIFFFWPKDFTFVCPTEIVSFAELCPEFSNRNCQVYGISTDSEYVHLAWRNSHPELKDLPFPMLSDIKRELSQSFGILHKQEGVCLRATFIVDPTNTIRCVNVNDLDVGRNPHEILRILDGLQTERLTPCNWQRGDDVITVA